jgi:preprotein translocase subunit YajC
MREMLYLLAPNPNGAQGGGQSILVSLLPIVLMIAIFYFLLIRPQQRKQKEHRQMLDSVRKGDRIITTGGILGVVTGVRDDRVTVKIADNVRVHVLKSAISQITKRGDEEDDSIDTSEGEEVKEKENK